MSFAWDITIPAGTTVANPYEKKLQITFGVITKIEVKFPRGCHGMVRCRLLRGGIFCYAPLNPDSWVTGDDESVSWHTYYRIEDVPRELDFVGCSPGTSYDHTVTVRLEILPHRVASFVPLIELLSNMLTRMFR